MADLEAKQADLKKTLQHLIALSKIRDEAWEALSYGEDVQETTETEPKKERINMFKKLASGLMVIVMLVVGYGSFTGMTAQAAAPGCDSDSVMLASNPELKVTCHIQQRDNEGQTSGRLRPVRPDTAAWPSISPGMKEPPTPQTQMKLSRES